MKHFRNLGMAVVIAITLAGCSSTSKQEEAAAVRAAEAVADADRSSVQAFGAVRVKFDKKGNWTEISSLASAGVPDNDDPRINDAAMKLAATEAKRNIVTFLGTTVGYNTITKTSRLGDDIQIKSTDNVYERANALLKGLVIDQQYSEGDRVFARAVIRKTELGAAKQIRRDMLK